MLRTRFSDVNPIPAPIFGNGLLFSEFLKILSRLALTLQNLVIIYALTVLEVLPCAAYRTLGGLQYGPAKN